MFARLLALIPILALSLPGAAFQVPQVPPPRIAAEIYDGAPVDITAGPYRIWVAQGRSVAVLDSLTGARLGYDSSSPYATTVQAVEYDQPTMVRVVATTRMLHVYTPNFPHLSWEPAAGEGFPDFQDAKLWPGSNKVFAVAGNRVVVFDYSSGQLLRLSQADCPILDVAMFRRIHVREVDGRLMAYLIASVRTNVLPRQFSMVIADLDSPNGYAQLAFYVNDWRSFVHYNDPLASSRAVEVFPNLYGTQDVAFVADINGQVSVLDVSDPANPAFLSQIVLNGSCGPSTYAYNLMRDPTRSRLYVAGDDHLYIYELPSLTMIGCSFVHFVDAGKRDMALVRKRTGARMVWTATPHAVEYALNGIDVSTAQPTLTRQAWWISSSDGAVAAPEWHSVYLPTFGGVVRYDMSIESDPLPVAGSYQPANASTEHIEILYPNAADHSQALLVTATGAGGAQIWPVSQAAPNPGVPTLVRQTPATWGANPAVYQNDAEPYQRAGHNYVLSDLANYGTNQLALQAFDLTNGQYAEALVSSPFLKPSTNDICTTRKFAAVACNGGFFVVNLSGLPASMSICATKLVDIDGDGVGETVGGITANAAGTRLFVATDSVPAIASFALDPQTGSVSGPLCVLSGGGMTGCVGRIRLYEPTGRLYVPSRQGTLYEVLMLDPANLQLLSTWRSTGCNSELQDAHVYDFGHGPRVLAVKNTEGFALLDPDDGL